ncbi:hypothetical protein HYQ46_004193 [Verticillium longisporum]|nr:hypothetical protein HYQ46_004193 [Verticillium longisporum]
MARTSCAEFKASRVVVGLRIKESQAPFFGTIKLDVAATACPFCDKVLNFESSPGVVLVGLRGSIEVPVRIGSHGNGGSERPLVSLHH